MHFFRSNLEFLSFAAMDVFQPDRLTALKKDEEPLPEELIRLSEKSGYTIDSLLKVDLSLKAHLPKDIRLIIFDVDGVLTDAGMYYSESGDEYKKFNAKDGIAIRALKKAGFETGIISHGTNIGLIKRRAELLHIGRVYAGEKPKEQVLLEWCDELGIIPNQVAYIGDDINDLPVMLIVGFTACPSDATESVKNFVNVVLKAKGGEACVREWADRFFLQ